MINFDEVRQKAKSLLADGAVQAVLGYQKDPDGLMALPFFARSPEEADRLAWDPSCVHNLALYLVNEKKARRKQKEPDNRPIAIIAKGCDARSVNVLLQEKYFTRDEVIVLGISCEESGVIDQNRLDAEIGMSIALGAEFEGDGKFRFKLHDEDDLVLDAPRVMAQRCLECKYPVPPIHDELYGAAEVERSFTPRFSAIEKLEKAGDGEKWDFWKHHMDRCIRCFACRSVCPMCYCDECVVDSIEFALTPGTTAEEKANRPKWIERSAVASENIGYHLIRAMHLAGRCTDCGECERVCPVNIPLRLLNTRLEKASFEMFSHEAGLSADGPALVASFRDDDPNDFIR
jgi:ferredoxin